MSPPSNTRSPSYREYAALLRQLHTLIRGGEGDSSEADEIRDAMDGPWYRLEDAEVKIARALSADLYTLGVDAARRHDAHAEVSAEEERVASFMNNPEPLESLDRIRSDSHVFTPAEAALLRATIWSMRLRDFDSAILFAEESVRLAPTEWNHLLLLAWVTASLGSVVKGAKLIVEFDSKHPGHVPEDFLHKAKTCISRHRQYLEARRASLAAQEARREAVASTPQGPEPSHQLVRMEAERRQTKRLFHRAKENLRMSKAALLRSVPTPIA